MKKNTKKSLLFSVLALVLCVAMLASTTLAWFTDSVSTGVNKIEAGNLDIDLEYSKDGTNWSPVTSETTGLFGDVTLWEPGATSVVYLRLTNKGSLDLKYRFFMNVVRETGGTNVNNQPFKLSDYLQFSVIEGENVYATRDAARNAAGIGTVLSAQNTAGRAHDEVGTMKVGAVRCFALVVFMPETVDNKANYRGTAPTIDLGLNLTATQLASESDSFDNQYDGGAHYEDDLMQSASATVTAPVAGQNLEIVLNNNAPVSEEKSTTLAMETPTEFVGKKVEFEATTYNESATQNQTNFRIATGNNVEVAALRLDLKVNGENANLLDNTTPRTVTTYIATGLNGVTVTYVPETGEPVVIPASDTTYNPTTGKLTFKTTHFSDYVVTAQALSETDGVYEIYSDADLFTFARLVNVKGNSFSGKTVKLMADIDLTGKTWTPVGQTGGYSAQTYFQGIFDGNGKTISNLTIPESTWEAGSNEGKHFASGFFGFIDAGGNTIKDVTFDHATVVGHHWVGVAAGYMTGTVENVTVKNSTITSTYKTGEADGDKAGGVVGYLNSNSSVTGCTVTDSTITAVRDCGSVVGFSAGTVTGNTAENCFVYYSTNNNEQIGGEIAGKRANGVSDNTATNVTVCKKVNVSTADELSAALNAAGSSGVTIMLTNDITGGGLTTRDNFPKTAVIDFNGHTYRVQDPGVGSTGTESQAMHWSQGSNITLKNGSFVVMANSTEIEMAMQNYGTFVAENMKFDFSAIPVEHYGEYTGQYAEFSYKEVPMFCTNGAPVTMTRCTVKMPADSTKGITADEKNGAASQITLNDCTIEGYVCCIDTGSKVTNNGSKWTGFVSYFDKYQPVQNGNTYSVA